MNLPEKLARELVRVTKLLRAYEDIGPPGMFGVTMIKASLENGCRAAGTGDIEEQMAAVLQLEGHNK